MEKYFLFGLIFLGILLIVCFVVIYKLYKKVNVLQKKQLTVKKKTCAHKKLTFMTLKN